MPSRVHNACSRVLASGAEEQTIAYVQKLVPDEVEKFRKLLAK